MAEIASTIQDAVFSLQNLLPERYKSFVILALYTLVIVIYSIFVWKFYRFLAKRDLLQLNLQRYSTSQHPQIEKTLKLLLYLLEYIIILPVIVFIWFGILATFLLLLSEGQSVSQILLITAGVIASVRMTSYFSEDLSRDLAKIFPFTILVVFLLNPSSFSTATFLERISEIPQLLNNILQYLVFIIALEGFMRLMFTIIYAIWPPTEEEEYEEAAEKQE